MKKRMISVFLSMALLVSALCGTAAMPSNGSNANLIESTDEFSEEIMPYSAGTALSISISDGVAVEDSTTGKYNITWNAQVIIGENFSSEGMKFKEYGVYYSNSGAALKHFYGTTSEGAIRRKVFNSGEDIDVYTIFGYRIKGASLGATRAAMFYIIYELNGSEHVITSDVSEIVVSNDVDIANGAYEIKNQYTNKYIPYNTLTDGQNIYTSSTPSILKWGITKSNDNYFTISSYYKLDHYIAVDSSVVIRDGTNGSEDSKLWFMDGEGRIRPKLSPDKALSEDSSGMLTLTDIGTSQSEKWILESVPSYT